METKEKMTRDELIEKLANTLTDSADMDCLIDYFRQGQIDFLESMIGNDLEDYAKEVLNYEVEVKETI